MKPDRALDDKLNSLGLLACGLAHDIVNFMTGITGTTGLLKDRYSRDEIAQLYCDRILLACKKITDLSYGVLDFAKDESSSDSRFSVNQILEETALLLETMKVSVHVDLDRDLDLIQGNRSMVYMALLNLSINAAQALKPSGNITLLTRNVEAPRGEKYVGVKIIDDGVGMSTETLEKAFEPLFTARPDGSGTGMGLTIVRRVIDEHNGKIKLDSTPGQGTVVELTFPAVESTVRRLPGFPEGSKK